jgi:E3 ubiquitin-protein ligase UBR1
MSKRRLSGCWAQLMPPLESDSVLYLRKSNSLRTSYRAATPPDLRDLMSRTVAYALDFVLDTQDNSPDEVSSHEWLGLLFKDPSLTQCCKTSPCVVLEKEI